VHNPTCKRRARRYSPRTTHDRDYPEQPLAEVTVGMSRTPPYLSGRPDRAAPLYGEDNAATRTGLLGMSDEEVAELTEPGSAKPSPCPLESVSAPNFW
jgi:crotonobetainyl-CoA:carnitine CoA-transferase CaiB-like acyl-CoA transferase